MTRDLMRPAKSIPIIHLSHPVGPVYRDTKFPSSTPISISLQRSTGPFRFDLSLGLSIISRIYCLFFGIAAKMMKT
ncbi:hypothetical protein OIDMADRAFT_17656 [Oidiodendron maius Zn]|uniref:Uncharacterized protein n=1 Tax=Oidiodendron maius (strain Zn) TaxID=913774 RepID=A0A0C3HNY0_OIDMZ|nr:hypothetical protein OIDMADRAFT_17656 [Oidiodendron maius Zn]